MISNMTVQCNELHLYSKSSSFAKYLFRNTIDYYYFYLLINCFITHATRFYEHIFPLAYFYEFSPYDPNLNIDIGSQKKDNSHLIEVINQKL